VKSKDSNMKIFVSWSGERSKTIANTLKHWLPDVFQGLQVWMSDHDIQAGVRWGSELGGELETSNFGILCLTPENLQSLWLAFEAGALSKAIKESRVAPYRFQLRTSDVGPPLSQFQGVDANEEGTFKLVLSINDALGKPLPDEPATKRVFAHWWPDLQKTLAEIPSTARHEIRSDERLPHLAEQISPIRQVHGYSGKWKVKSSFTRWRGRPVRENEEVTFDGLAFLSIEVDGGRGSGMQMGVLSVNLTGFEATFKVANEIEGALVNKEGTMEVRVIVRHRYLVRPPKGEPPADLGKDWLAELESAPSFKVKLEPVLGKSKYLLGTHLYEPGKHPHQEAKEDWDYLDK
jgi:hypothetical protein